MDIIRKWFVDFFNDPIGSAFDWGFKTLQVAIGIAILMFFLGLARNCVGL